MAAAGVAGCLQGTPGPLRSADGSSSQTPSHARSGAHARRASRHALRRASRGASRRAAMPRLPPRLTHRARAHPRLAARWVSTCLFTAPSSPRTRRARRTTPRPRRRACATRPSSNRAGDAAEIRRDPTQDPTRDRAKIGRSRPISSSGRATTGHRWPRVLATDARVLATDAPCPPPRSAAAVPRAAPRPSAVVIATRKAPRLGAAQRASSTGR